MIEHAILYAFRFVLRGMFGPRVWIKPLHHPRWRRPDHPGIGLCVKVGSQVVCWLRFSSAGEMADHLSYLHLAPYTNRDLRKLRDVRTTGRYIS